MQLPTHGQWWSNFSTHILQVLQWETPGGLIMWQVLQNFTLNRMPLMYCSLFLEHATTHFKSLGVRQFVGRAPGSVSMQIDPKINMITRRIISIVKRSKRK